MEQTGKRKNIVQAAMEAGAIMGAFFVVKFVFTVLSLSSSFAGLLSTFMILTIPLVVYYLMRRYYRESGGETTFSQLWLLGILLFFFASLISALVQYIYYVYINPDYIKMQFEMAGAAVQMMESMNTLPASSLEPYKQVMAQGNIPAPMDFVMAQMWINITFGSLLSAVMAGACSYYFKKIKRD